MKNLAIIPARGGSKRISGKNIKLFLGKPIIAYSIEIALKSGLFENVMVSTDNEDIAKIAIKYNAEVPFLRSKETSNDFAPLNDVVQEVKSEYQKLNNNFDNICLILSTAPLIKINSLNKGYEMLINSNFDSVRPVIAFGFPIQRAFILGENSGVEPMFPLEFKKRSQDLQKTFHDSGQFYWIKGDKDLSENKGAFEIQEYEAQDIDNENDWKLAEMKYRLLFNQ